MPEFASVQVTLEVPDERSCALCGADEDTPEELTGGFLAVDVVPPRLAESFTMARRFLCAGCLTSVLGACEVGWAGQVAQLSVAAQDEREDPNG